jgi:ArsR family transcriptional regulator
MLKLTPLPDSLLSVISDDAACCETDQAPVTVPASLTRLLKALADDTRLQLLGKIASSTDPICVCDLVDSAAVNQSTVSHHLKVLREAGVVEFERRGTWAYYSLKPGVSPVVTAVLTELEVSAPFCEVPPL